MNKLTKNERIKFASGSAFHHLHGNSIPLNGSLWVGIASAIMNVLNLGEARNIGSSKQQNENKETK